MPNIVYRKSTKAVQLSASFVPTDGGVEAIVTGGRPPYQYNWDYAQIDRSCKILTTPATSSKLIIFNNLENNTLFLSDSSTTFKLDVTDSVGNKDTFQYTYNPIGYLPMPMNIGREITASFCSEVMMTASVPRERIDFLDSYEMTDLYQFLNTVKDFTADSLMQTDYRIAADLYSSNLRIKFVADRYNQNHVEATGTVYNPPEFDVNTTVNSMLTMSKNIVFPHNMYFREYNILNGCEAYQYSYYWNLNNSILTGSIYDHIGNVKLRFLPSIEVGPPVDPGVAGDIVVATGSLPISSYAWSVRDSQWSQELVSHILQIEADRKARADSHDSMARETLLSIGPFLAAAYYYPLHKIR